MRITFDSTCGAPGAGDWLVTTRSHYLVIAARRIRSVKHANRWALEVEKLPAPESYAGTRVFHMRWNPRNRRGRA